MVDALSDGDEISASSNLNRVDSDLDGLSDGDEVNLHKTNATKSDTDNDGAKETGYISRH